MSDFLFEKLAEVAHLIWARWAMYAEEHNDAEHRQRWRIQARTLYADLSESEKEFDREIADQWIAAMDIGQCAEMRFLRDNLTERELQVRHLVRAHEQTVDSLVAQMDSLRARVAELEALAAIGRAFLALPDRSEVWIDRGSPCNVAGLNPILSNLGLLSAVRRYVQKGESKE